MKQWSPEAQLAGTDALRFLAGAFRERCCVLVGYDLTDLPDELLSPPEVATLFDFQEPSGWEAWARWAGGLALLVERGRVDAVELVWERGPHGPRVSCVTVRAKGTARVA